MTGPSNTTLGDLGEEALIRRLAGLVPPLKGLGLGIGDDAAVVPGGNVDLLLTSDAVIEGRHFTQAADPEAIGHKAMARTLSDVAAMGGKPRWALVDLVAPPTTPLARCEAIYRGLARSADLLGVTVVGGDTAEGDVLALHVFAVGEVPCGEAVLRSGASPGDAIYVTGALGGSLAGRHLAFLPRLAEGQWLRSGGWASSMIDLSDGLATDVRRLADRSGVGVEINPDRVPIAAAARIDDGRSLLEHALCDGEDYELLFTVPPESVDTFPGEWSRMFELACTRVGRIIAEEGACYLARPDGGRTSLDMHGFGHFAAGPGAGP